MKSSTFKYGCSFAVSCCIAGVLSGCGESVRDVAYYKNNTAALVETVASKDCNEIMAKMIFGGGYKNSKETLTPRAMNCFYATKALQFLPRSKQQEVTLQIIEREKPKK